jgi:hypothetical protein
MRSSVRTTRPSGTSNIPHVGSTRKYLNIFEYIRGILKNIQRICPIYPARKGRNGYVRPSARFVRDVQLPLNAQYDNPMSVVGNLSRSSMID